MPILYSVISRGTTVLARFASCTGNFVEVTEQVLSQIGVENSKMTYSHGSYLFHYLSEDRIIYLCITDDVSSQDYDVNIPFPNQFYIDC
jgi:vesicle-associated membrane protein 7